MTKQQLVLVTCAYLIELIAVVFLTRALGRRVVGALAGGAVVGWLGLGAIGLGERMGWWHVPIDSSPGFLVLFYLGFVISCSPIYLVTWRLVRRFGWRGLAVFVTIVGIIGPPRDYLIAAKFPAWMVFGPGIVPVLADAAAYVGLVVVGHAVMSLVAGPARGDRLARAPRGSG